MVFLDDHNACLSQLAEAIANSLGQPQFVFASAGLDPRPIDADTLAFLRAKQIDPGQVVSRSVAQVPNLEFAQVIVALSPEARRAFPKGSKAVCLDWSLEDPSLVGGSPEQKQAAYAKAFNFLHEHISELCEAVAGDRID
jgi:protein-tyrosine-phosphatase